MKRILTVLAAALLVQAVTLYAQESGEPSEQSVLEKARAKYWGEKESSNSGQSEDRDDEGEAEGLDPGEGLVRDDRDEGDRARYTPVILSFVPGVSMPFGYYDASLAAGAVGTIARDVAGAAGSGVFTIVRDMVGAQGSGVFNLAREVRGGQGAGVFNIADRVQGGQGAGVFNIAEDADGFQGAGVFNIAGDAHMLIQGSGVFNIAGDIGGVQAAGLFNVADRVRGVQIGIVNIAGHIDGVQLGLVNLAGNGIDSLGLVYEPATAYAYAFWQAGTPAFYSIARAGARFDGWEADPGSSVASYGFGSRSRLLGIALDVDLSAEQPIGALPWEDFPCGDDWSGWEGWSAFRPYPSLRAAASMPIGHHWRLTAGVKADMDVDRLGSRVPESLKGPKAWSFELFDAGFMVWPKWFFGLTL